MAKIMRTIADVESDIRRETTSKPLLTDDYEYGNLDNVREKLSQKSHRDILSDDPLETEIEENDLI